jgi:hypothetical protein
MHLRRHLQQQQLLPLTVVLQAAAGVQQRELAGAVNGSRGQQRRVGDSSARLAGVWGLSSALLLQLSWQHQQQQQQQRQLACPQPLQHLRLLQQQLLRAAGRCSSLRRSTLHSHWKTDACGMR